MDVPNTSPARQPVIPDSRRWYRRRQVVGIALALVVLGAAGLFWWKYSAENTNNAVAPLPAPEFSAAQDQLVRDRVREAEQKAKTSWQDDAALMVASLQFTNLALSPESPPITYFFSANDTENDYYCEISADLTRLGNCGVEPKITESAEPPLLAITDVDWPRNIGAVITEAEKQGGKYFRLTHPEAQFVLELTNTATAGTIWKAIYDSVDAAAPQVIPVDAVAAVQTKTNGGQ